MPKIIENLESRLLEEAKKQLFALGYGTMTIRSVAKACGVGIGTVYNYYASKDDMIAMVMQKDLDECFRVVRERAGGSDSVEDLLRHVYDQLVTFSREHSGMFRDQIEAANFLGAFNIYRKQLRDQIAQILRSYCQSDFESEFVAEALLTWTTARKSFEDIYGMIAKILVQPQT